MAIVFPSAAIARRWDGALQARLKRAPLEAFLRARDVVPAKVGAAQDTDDVARAVVLIVDSGLWLNEGRWPAGGVDAQYAALSHIACIVSRALAELIGQPRCWRIAAILSAARLLSPALGVHEAARTSARTVRRFHKHPPSPSPLEQRAADAVSHAITQDTPAAMEALAAAIAACLNPPRAHGAGNAVGVSVQSRGYF